MFASDLALMIPIVAVVVWSPIGRAIAGSISAVNEEMRAKAERIRRGASTWDLHMGSATGSSSATTAPPEDPEIALRIQALEEEIQHLREAAVMAPWSPKTIGQRPPAVDPPQADDGESRQQRRIAQ